MLRLDQVHSFYGRSHTLHGVNLAVPKGGVLAVLGRNGVGKTTLLKAIMGLTDRITGSIQLLGDEVGRLETYQRARAGIGYVPQGRQIVPDFTVRENIAMGGFANTGGKTAMPDMVPDLFPYIAANMDRRGGLLSGGQQQQLAIARALATNPTVLLLDEPTEGIQPNVVEQIEDAVIALNRQMGMTIVLVEQNIAFARRAATSFVFMEKGQVATAGPIRELSDELVQRYMTI